jgi:Zn-dependent protease
MSSQDRSYYRDSRDHRPGSLARLAGGSFQMFSAGGIRVRVHAGALLVAMVYLAAGAADSSLPRHLLTIGVLLTLVLLHESGHCFAAMLLGGSTEEVLLWPLGGLVDARPPHRPLSVLITALAGPMANMAACTACWVALRFPLHSGSATLNPFALALPSIAWTDPRFYLLLIFDLSYLMMLVNLLPIPPLDGGRVLQCILWPSLGYGRALLSACNVGILLALAIGLVAVALGNWLLCFVMLSCLVICVQRRAVVSAAGVGSYDELSGALPRQRRHRLNRLAKWRARRQIRREEAETIRVDEILSKVYHGGIHSLSWGEKRLLRRATVRQRECATEETSRRS